MWYSMFSMHKFCATSAVVAAQLARTRLHISVNHFLGLFRQPKLGERKKKKPAHKEQEEIMPRQR